jgi:hypothetical protein
MAESGKPVVDGGLSYVTRGWATGMVPINSTVGLSPRDLASRMFKPTFPTRRHVS